MVKNLNPRQYNSFLSKAMDHRVDELGGGFFSTESKAKGFVEGFVFALELLDFNTKGLKEKVMGILWQDSRSATKKEIHKLQRRKNKRYFGHFVPDTEMRKIIFKK